MGVQVGGRQVNVNVNVTAIASVNSGESRHAASQLSFHNLRALFAISCGGSRGNKLAQFVCTCHCRYFPLLSTTFHYCPTGHNCSSSLSPRIPALLSLPIIMLIISQWRAFYLQFLFQYRCFFFTALYFFAMLGRLGSSLHCIYAIINSEEEQNCYSIKYLMTIFKQHSP